MYCFVNEICIWLLCLIYLDMGLASMKDVFYIKFEAIYFEISMLILNRLMSISHTTIALFITKEFL